LIVTLLYNEPGEHATVDDRDVLLQRDAVFEALRKLGHSTTCLGCTLDLDAVRQRLREQRPDVVFNLVESLGETDRLMPLVPLLLDALAIPYTGSPTETIIATSDKLSAKAQMRAAGLPTPRCRQGSSSLVAGRQEKRPTLERDTNWIIKPVWEHASIGMDDGAVIRVTGTSQLESSVQMRQARTGKPYFAEQFIDGREFNLSMLAGEVLPPAEIDFSSFPPGKPRIVGHQAKWEPDSFEYQCTPRRFDFPESDLLLLEQLSQLARRCWSLFHLGGYARVDFRVDYDGLPWILEINANPCLSPDAGFAAALTQAGIPFCDAIQQILVAANQPLAEARGHGRPVIRMSSSPV
jgi:D-alanine-D-alanine ligase